MAQENSDNNLKNVVIFGETGSGKSSIVNMLLNQNKAKVSDAAVGCTFKFECFKYENYNIYDTAGLSEGSRGLIDYKNSIMALAKLLKALKNGVNLLILVMRKDRIKKTIEENYKLFVETICMSEVPVILVVTHCEMDKVLGEWWLNNKTHFEEEYGMKFNECICVCATKGENMLPIFAPLMQNRYEESRDNLMKCIDSLALSDGWRMKSFIEWFSYVVKKIINFFCSLFSLPAIPYWPEFKQRLIEVGIEATLATQLTNELVASSKEED